MKLLIALALIGLTSAASNEEVQPVVLPEAPVPAYEAEVEPISLGVLIVPQEVIDEVARAQVSEDLSADIPAEPVLFVDHSEDVSADIPVDPVHFVDNSEDVSADSVIIVDVAEEVPAPLNNFDNTADEQLDSIRVVDLPIELQEQTVDSVQFVDMPLSDDVPQRYPGKVYDDPMWR